MAWRFLALWAIALAPAPASGGEPAAVRTLDVAVDRLDVLAEPDGTAFATATLARGDRVEVRRLLAGGWVAIAQPAGSFYWVDEADVEPLRDGRLYVKSPRTLLRFGRDGLGQPGPPRRMLLEGMVVAPADHARLVEGGGRRRRAWVAVAAGADEVRFVPASALADPKVVATPRPAVEPAVRRATHAEAAPTRTAADRPAPPKADELGEAAREFDAIVRESRRRDTVLGQVRDSLRDLREAEDLAFDAEGLLQLTSLRVDGEKVFALIDRQGRVATYVKVPAGLDTTNLVARQVGVRGKSRFDDGLKFRLLDARDVEPLAPD